MVHPHCSRWMPAHALFLFAGLAWAQDAFLLGTSIYDFSKNHPDFVDSKPSNGTQLHLGMVAPTLGPDRDPIKGATDYYNDSFEDWFRPVSGVNHSTCYDLPLSRTSEGTWQFDSDPLGGFFPIDGLVNDSGLVTNEPQEGGHNFHFCMEVHTQLTYHAGQKFDFRGDDDVWVFINDTLVIDLGGTHSAVAASVLLDTLGLEDGKQYPFDFFYCERKTASSNLLLTTSIEFVPRWGLEARTLNLSPPLQGWEFDRLSTGTGADCFQSTLRDTVPASIQVLLGGGSLTGLTGIHDMAGIEIDTLLGRVVLDTSVVTLAAGNYYLLVRDRESGLSDTLAFTVPVRQVEPPPDTPVVQPVPPPVFTHAVVRDSNADGFADWVSFQVPQGMGEWSTVRWAFHWENSPLPSVWPLGTELIWRDSVSAEYSGPLTEERKTSGTAELLLVVAKGMEVDTVSLPVTEEIAPVILSATLSAVDDGTRLDLQMSESLHSSLPDLYPVRDGFLFRRKDGADSSLALPAQSMRLRGGDSLVVLWYPQGSSADVPAGGDSVRLAPGVVMDLLGNPAPANAPFELIRGARKVRITSNSLLTLSDGPWDGSNAAFDAFAVEDGSKAFDVGDSLGRLGLLLNIDFAGMASMLPDSGSQGGGIAALQVYFEVFVFDQIGQFVNNHSWQASCSDTLLFDGDCTRAEKNLFIGWNGRSSQGRKVATGVYLARIHVQVTGNGHRLAEWEKMSRWGVVRRSE